LRRLVIAAGVVVVLVMLAALVSIALSLRTIASEGTDVDEVRHGIRGRGGYRRTQRSLGAG
jgi:hypothetical protein